MSKVKQTVEEKAARGQTIVTQGPPDRSSEKREGDTFSTTKMDGDDGDLSHIIKGNKVPRY